MTAFRRLSAHTSDAAPWKIDSDPAILAVAYTTAAERALEIVTIFNGGPAELKQKKELTDNEKRKVDTDLLASFALVTEALSTNDEDLLTQLKAHRLLHSLLDLASTAPGGTLISASLGAIAALISQSIFKDSLSKGGLPFKEVFESPHLAGGPMSAPRIGGSLISLLQALTESVDGLRVISGQGGITALQERTVSLKQTNLCHPSYTEP